MVQLNTHTYTHISTHACAHSNEASLDQGGRFILLLPPRAPYPTVAELQVNCSSPGSTVMKRDETATININLPWGTLRNRTNCAATLEQPYPTVAYRNKTWQIESYGGNSLAFCPAAGKLHCFYGLIRSVTFCYVLPVLLRLNKQVISTVATMANFLTIEKFASATTATKASYNCPSRSPTLCHDHPVLSTVAWNVTALTASNIV